MMVLEIPITNYIFNMLEHKAKNVLLVPAPVWNTKLSQLTKYCTNDNNFKRLEDNETFFLENKFYYDQYCDWLPVCP